MPRLRFVGGPLDGHRLIARGATHSHTFQSKAAVDPVVLTPSLRSGRYMLDNRCEGIQLCLKVALYERGWWHGGTAPKNLFLFCCILGHAQEAEIRECLSSLGWSARRIDVAVSSEWPEPDIEGE